MRRSSATAHTVKHTSLRERVHEAGHRYVLAISPQITVFTPETTFVVAERATPRGRRPSRARPDRKPVAITALVAELDQDQLVSLPFRDGPGGEPVTSRFAFLRIRAGNRFGGRIPWPPDEEWLIVEWPPDSPQPTDYSDLQPAREHPARVARTPGAHALGDRARLHAAQGRARA